MSGGVVADAGSALFSNPMLQLLMGIVGGTQDQNVTKNATKTGTSTGTQNVTGTQAQTTNQSQNQQSTGKTTGTQQQTSAGTTQNIADVGNLQTILSRQMAGITPEALSAIFQEGARAVPQLISGTANAVGARAVNNDPMATALTDLSGRLTNQAALLDMQQKNQAAGTAETIARLTSRQQTTGSQTGSSTQDVFQQLLNTMLSQADTTTNQTTNTSSNTSETANETTNNQVDTGVDTGNISKLLGGLLLGSMMNQGLPGGIGGTIGNITRGGGNLIGSLLQAIGLGGGSGMTIDPNGLGMGDIGAASPEIRDLLRYIEHGYASNTSDADFWNMIGIDPGSISPFEPDTAGNWWENWNYSPSYEYSPEP